MVFCHTGFIAQLSVYVIELIGRDLDHAEISYLHALRLDPTNNTALASLAMISHLRLDVRGAVRLYHAALALSPQDAIVTVLLEMALKEAGAMDVTTMPGIPVELQVGIFDPARLVRRAIKGGHPTAGPASSLPPADIQGGEEMDESTMSLLPEREDSVRLTRGRGGRGSRATPGVGGSSSQNGYAGSRNSASSSPKKRGARAGTEERRMTRSMSRGVDLGTPGVREVSMEDESMDFED